MSSSRLLRAAAWLTALAVGACSSPPAGIVGDRGRVAFQGETELMFTTRMVVGSHGVVRAVARRDDVNLVGATAVSSDVAVAQLEPLVSAGDDVVAFVMRMVGPGVADLVVQSASGEAIDSIHVEAARPSRTELVDGTLLALAQSIDTRLPETFALMAETELSLLVAATDRCGGPLLDLHASSLAVAGGAEALVADVGPSSFTVQSVPGEMSLTLDTPGIAPLAYALTALSPDSIDEVHAEVATVESSSSSARLWGRAFSNDLEVVGLEFDWSSDPRVALDVARGVSTTATISFPLEGEPPDDRPARVTAEVFGERGSVDLLALTATGLVTSRAAPPLRDGDDGDNATDEADESASCGGDACDPFVAMMLPGLFLLRRRALLPVGTSPG